MITVNGRKFARTKDEFVSSLFDAGGTAFGFFALRGAGILLMDGQKMPIAYIANDGRSQWFVTASRQEDGRTRYMFGLATYTAEMLGLDTLRYIEQNDIARAAIQQVA